MIIDAHNHVLGVALPPGQERFIKQMRGSPMRAAGTLPNRRPVSDEDWEGLESAWTPIDPVTLIEDHRRAGVDRSVVLAVAPSDYTEYGLRGTVDLGGATTVPGVPSTDHANDYIAALTTQYDHLLGMAAVNPRHRGVPAARQELRRAIGELGLTGLKLYPMYDHYDVADDELAMPIFDEALELSIPVMVHMGTTPARGAQLAYGMPIGLDEVARRHPELRILICHAAFPWTDDCLALVARHEHLYLDVSYFIGRVSQADIYAFLMRAKQLDCPLSRICWATDYPGGGTPAILLPKFALVNNAANGGSPVSETDMAWMLGGNWARFAGLDSLNWSEEQTIAQMREWDPQWRELLRAAAPGVDDNL